MPFSPLIHAAAAAICFRYLFSLPDYAFALYYAYAALMRFDLR